VSGGAQRQLVTLVNALDRTEIEPVVAVYHKLDHFRPDLERTGTRIVSLGTSGAKNPMVLLRLTRLLKREEFDLVHCYMRVPGILARLATVLGRRVPVLLSERNVDLGHSAFRLLLERALAGRAAALIANAEVVKERVERKLPSLSGRVVTVLNGVELPEPTQDERNRARAFRDKHIGDAKLLLSVVARVSEQKDPHTLLDALESMTGVALRDLKVVWIGGRIDQALAASVEERLLKPVLRGRLELLPPTRDVSAAYLASDGLVLTSLWEGLPNAVLEAMSYGLPVVATDAGGTRELVTPGRTGWLVPAGDSDALARALDEFVRSSDEERAGMGRAGADFVREHCSVEQLVRNTVEVYRRVFERETSRGVDAGARGAHHE
jgi:glycosyltransferase involved in cell wall biosynthesis